MGNTPNTREKCFQNLRNPTENTSVGLRRNFETRTFDSMTDKRNPVSDWVVRRDNHRWMDETEHDNESHEIQVAITNFTIMPTSSTAKALSVKNGSNGAAAVLDQQSNNNGNIHFRPQ